jgi:hypothetical protein
MASGKERRRRVSVLWKERVAKVEDWGRGAEGSAKGLVLVEVEEEENGVRGDVGVDMVMVMCV